MLDVSLLQSSLRKELEAYKQIIPRLTYTIEKPDITPYSAFMQKVYLRVDVLDTVYMSSHIMTPYITKEFNTEDYSRYFVRNIITKLITDIQLAEKERSTI